MATDKKSQAVEAIIRVLDSAYEQGLSGEPNRLFPNANTGATLQEIHDMAVEFLDECQCSEGLTYKQDNFKLYQILLNLTKADITEYIRGLTDHVASHDYTGEVPE